jgi:restriction system protein
MAIPDDHKTPEFTKSAIDYVSRIDSKIELLDGITLAQLMIDFIIGVTLAASYEIIRIDSDYFTDE